MFQDLENKGVGNTLKRIRKYAARPPSLCPITSPTSLLILEHWNKWNKTSLFPAESNTYLVPTPKNSLEQNSSFWNKLFLDRSKTFI